MKKTRLTLHVSLVLTGVLSPCLVFGQDKTPVEILSLIGTKIPDIPTFTGLGRRSGSISDVSDEWSCLGGTAAGEFVIETCYHKNGLSALFAHRHPPEDGSYSIVIDAVAVRSSEIHIPYEVREKLGVKGKPKQRRYSYMTCETTNRTKVYPRVIAIGKPEKNKPIDCPHFTQRIDKAWRLETTELRLAPYPIENLACWWNACLLEKKCRNEDQCSAP